MFLRPRTLLHLTFIAFLTVSAPLIIALLINVRQLDTFGDNSQRSVARAAEAMHASSALFEQTLAMERSARQFAVLGDPRILDIYFDRRRDFIQAARALNNLAVNDGVSAIANQLVDSERRAFGMLRDAKAGAQVARVADSEYPPLSEMANRVAGEIRAWIDGQLLDLGRQSVSSQRLMWLEAGLFAFAALLLAGIFTALITRPLRQLDLAIRRLGGPDLGPPVHISGPNDLRELGERLEWLRNRLAELEQQRITFLRHVSHDLKTPLTAIQEGAALIGDGLAGPLSRQQAEIIVILGKKCRQLQRLIEDLLRFNSSGADPLLPRACAFPFDLTVERVISEHALAIEAGGIRVLAEIDPIDVQGDPDQLRVVVDNLLANAIRYSPPQGEIHVRLARDADCAVLEIHDEGPGIPEHQRHLVFEAFYQGRPPTDRHAQGTGLGLAITMNYVQLNGGEIRILEAERGARFSVRIPATSREEES